MRLLVQAIIIQAARDYLYSDGITRFTATRLLAELGITSRDTIRTIAAIKMEAA